MNICKCGTIMYAPTVCSACRCRCAKWRLRAFALRCCHLASKSEFQENIARILALAAEANAKADLEECHAGRMHP